MPPQLRRSRILEAAISALVVTFTTVPAAIRAAQSSGPASAQATAAPLSFDAASVKERAPGDMKFMMGTKISAGRFTNQCANLKALLSFAYNLAPFSPINALPDWGNAAPGGPNNYDVEATMAASATRDQVRQMMQTLLADRFKLAVHWSNGSTPAYALVIASSGFKGRPAAPDEKDYPSKCPPEDLKCNVLLLGVGTASDLASALSGPLGRLVVDQTGVTGTYHMGFAWAGNDSQDSPLPSLPTALKENLGLELKSETAPINVLVIDHVEKPTPN